MLYENTVDNRRQLCSLPLTVKQEEIPHWPPILLLPSHLPSSQWRSLFIAGDLIYDICASVFLKRAKKDCFDPFHMRKFRPAQPEEKSYFFPQHLPDLLLVDMGTLHLIYMGYQWLVFKINEQGD